MAHATATRVFHGLRCAVAVAVALATFASATASAAQLAPDAETVHTRAPVSSAAGAPEHEHVAIDSAETKAMALRNTAQDRFFEGDLAGALEAFSNAYALAPHPTDLYNMGRIHEENGQLALALDRYEQFVSQPHIPLDERSAAAERIEVLRKLVRPRQNPPPVASTASPSAQPLGDTPRTKPARALVVAGISLTSIGAALAVGGGLGFGLVARRNSDKIDDLAQGRNPDRLQLAQAEDLDARGKDFETLQIASLAAGGAAITVGVSLLVAGLLRRHRRAPALAWLDPSFGTPPKPRVGLQTGWRF